LKNVTLDRKTDDILWARISDQSQAEAEETDFPVNDPGVSANARRRRWEQLMGENKGRST